MEIKIMKKIFFIAALSTIAASAFAQSGPRIIPGAPMELSQDAVKIARILTSRQVAKCVDQLNDVPFQFSLNKVTRQMLAPGRTRYSLSGILLEGGDMVTGSATISIMETTQRGVFGNPIKVYNCNTTFNRLR